MPKIVHKTYPHKTRHRWKFGDLMRYPKSNDPSDPPDWVFMFISYVRQTPKPTLGVSDYLNVVVVRAHWQDDLWETGTPLIAGINEMVPYVE